MTFTFLFFRATTIFTLQLLFAFNIFFFRLFFCRLLIWLYVHRCLFSFLSTFLLPLTFMTLLFLFLRLKLRERLKLGILVSFWSSEPTIIFSCWWFHFISALSFFLRRLRLFVTFSSESFSIFASLFQPSFFAYLISFCRSKFFYLQRHLIDIWCFVQMTCTNIVMVASKTNEFFFIETFVMKSLTTTNTVVTSHLCWLGIITVANRTIVRWASKLLCWYWNVLDYSSGVIWEFVLVFFGEEAVQVIKSMAFSRKGAFVNGVIVLLLNFSSSFCSLWPWTDGFFLIVVALF